MTTEIQKYDPKTEIIIQEDMVLSKDEIKKHYTPGATDDELAVFIMTANAFKLNPIKREIHFVKYGSGPGKCVIGYQSYIKRAEETGRLKGYTVDYQGEPPRSTCTVTIHRKDWEVPFTWQTAYGEVAFASGKGDSKYLKSAGFKVQPVFMHKKTTICQAFRLAFPTELGGMPYEESELPSGEPVKADYTVENGLPHIETVDADADMPFRENETTLSRLEMFMQAHYHGKRESGKKMLKMAFGTVAWTKIKKLDDEALTEGYNKIKDMLDGVSVESEAVEESGSTKSEGEKPVGVAKHPHAQDPDILKILNKYCNKKEHTVEDVDYILGEVLYPPKDPAAINGNLAKDEFSVVIHKIRDWYVGKELAE